MDTLSKRASWLASCAGISLSETDSLAGKTRNHWQAITTGVVTNPKLDTLSKYARVLGCAVGWLATGEGDPPTADEVRAAVERARAAQTPAHTASDFHPGPKPEAA